jgi:hypothetical protein
MTAIDDQFVRYLAERDRQRTERVDDVIGRLNGFELHLATACAVMGWVQGFRAGRGGDTDVGNFPKLPIVIAHCLSMPDLYPVIAALDDGLRPEDEGFLAAVRRHQCLDDEAEDDE